MEEKLREVIERVHKLGRANVLSSSTTGAVTNRQNISLDLHKKASELLWAKNDRRKLSLALNDFRGAVLLAQATNTIGSKDLEDLMSSLDELESEL